jgi:hypothetical protein
MNWEETFKLISAMLVSIGGASIIILGLSTWLGKVWANRILEKEKAQLTQLTKEHEIRFSQLHIERAQVIKQIYGELGELYDSMVSLLKYFQGVDEPKMEEKAKAFQDAHTKFIKSISKNKIYFSKESCEIMERLSFASRDAYIDITTYPIDPRDPEIFATPGLYRERSDLWEEVREKFKNDIIKLKERLEDNFRKILGV